MLLLASFFWGSTFIIQSDGASKLPTFTFLACRSFVGAVALWIIVALRGAILKGRGKLPVCADAAKKKAKVRHYLISGLAVGAVLTVAAMFQQEGIARGATAGEAGFLTALYMFFVPLYCFVLYRKKLQMNLFAGAVLMAAGLYFICIYEKGWSSIGGGHIFILISAVTYAAHIVMIDRFKDVDGMTLSAMQFTVVAAISGVAALIFDRGVAFTQIVSASFPILYAGLFSSAVGFTLQIYGQQNAPPTLATIVMSLESVIALLCEWGCGMLGILGVERGQVELTPVKIVGCLLAFAGIVTAQLSFGAFFRSSGRKKRAAAPAEKAEGDAPEAARDPAEKE